MANLLVVEMDRDSIMIKKTIKYIFILSCLFTIASCATVAKFEKRMDANIGMTKDQLISKMGIPDREYKTENFEIIGYQQTQMSSETKNNTTVVNGYLINTQTSSPYEMWCKLEFKLVQGVVQSYTYKGNMCRSQ